MLVFERKGRGKAIGGDASIFGSYLDERSYAAGDAFLSDVKASSTAIDGGHIDRTKLTGCFIESGIISQSQLAFTRVLGGTILRSHTHDAIIAGTVIGSAVKASSVSKAAVIENAYIEGLNIPPQMRIRGGKWHTLPRFLHVKNDAEGLDFGVTDAGHGNAFIACTLKPIDRWLKGRRRFGKVMGWSNETLDLISETLRQWQRYSTT